MLGTFSSGIKNWRFIANALEDKVYFIGRFNKLWKNPKSFNGVVGWGFKKTSVRARRYANKHNLPYIALEDGFLRSLGLGVSGSPSHSLIVDHVGIYYDAKKSSYLEQIIKHLELDAAQKQRSRHCSQLIETEKLSKYNQSKATLLPELVDREVVLVVDQTTGDSSIYSGLANASSFELMLHAALDENPAATVVIKTHPDVVVGRKAGHFKLSSLPERCEILAEDVSIWDLFRVTKKIYVVTSQVGFEALMAGKEVHCFGMPFYAGWGLTHDRLSCERRSVKRSLEHVFHAAYIDYCRYINPYTGARCEIEQTIDLLSYQKNKLEQMRGDWCAIGMSYWRRTFMKYFLGPVAQVTFIRNAKRIAATPAQRCLVWASKSNRFLENEVGEHSKQLVRVEDGFIRSVGLGADLVKPISLVFDFRGIYYDATRVSDLEHILNTWAFDDAMRERASKLRRRLVALGLSKYNVGRESSVEFPLGKPVILVPGQVESDASIRLGSLKFTSNLELLKIVRERNPEAFIVYKPHPDVVVGGRLGKTSTNELMSVADTVVTHISMSSLLDKVDEVHTLTSLTGFEALLRGKKVFTYGMPFYAGWGLTQDFLKCERRTARRTLDELIAATLILYPTYVDPVSGEFIDPETAVELIARQLEVGHRRPFMGRIYNLLRWRV